MAQIRAEPLAPLTIPADQPAPAETPPDPPAAPAPQ
jgi:hypothetical protein